DLGKVHNRLRASLTRIAALLSVSAALLEIAPATAATAAAAAATIIAAAWIVRIANGDHAARRESKLPFGYDGFSCFESFFDDEILIHAWSGRHRLRRHAPILPDDVDKGSVLPALYGLIRNRECIRTRRESQHDIDVLPGPQLAVAIWERALEL